MCPLPPDRACVSPPGVGRVPGDGPATDGARLPGPVRARQGGRAGRRLRQGDGHGRLSARRQHRPLPPRPQPRRQLAGTDGHRPGGHVEHSTHAARAIRHEGIEPDQSAEIRDYIILA